MRGYTNCAEIDIRRNNVHGVIHNQDPSANDFLVDFSLRARVAAMLDKHRDCVDISNVSIPD